MVELRFTFMGVPWFSIIGSSSGLRKDSDHTNILKPIWSLKGGDGSLLPLASVPPVQQMYDAATNRQLGIRELDSIGRRLCNRPALYGF